MAGVWLFPPLSKLIRVVLCAHSVCANNVIYAESPLSFGEPGISVRARQSADVTNANNSVERGVSNRLSHPGTLHTAAAFLIAAEGGRLVCISRRDFSGLCQSLSIMLRLGIGTPSV